ncbi:MAG: chemotaxis protein CheC [Sulfurimonas sp. RIFCSPLOWO2_12_FULL_36_74]|uniref:chemotaxis protein CheX n=1 Tax=unclassified Sulfurimonas TaxID=2623549 RepID=UPI0008C1A2BC|nr:MULTISPECIES: chemotaxis protein CheX [unclassified Sulfurimonas]OHD98513.1 MAG: chemotaxis protein CheC [Sulfurimonas sp. RIFCSPLOWO2_02_FULL_36_28]OHE00382.1 MAG: chemotaxis protein CheC [Sulfurimonas sp. RIFCSPLOWO2_12_36_12]OHE02317.1 MAG: chemotaxis protein CheC [Sulfurimonas sp. RIFCSPLOWO2_12_FULL_36_74]
MKAVVKNGIAVFSPQGFLDGNSQNAFMSTEDIEAATNLKADMILVSLKKVVFFNRNGLDIFIKLFLKIRKKNHITVGFCDYDSKKYDAIKRFFHDELNFSLFKTLDIAYLFSSSFKNQNKNILVYSSDKSQRSAIAIELHDGGHNPIIAQSEQEFNEKKEKKEAYDYIVDSTFLGQMGQKVATRVTGNAIIYTISSFLDVEISDKFNIEYHNNSLNVGFRLFIFDAYKVISMNVHALNFFSKLASSAAEYNANICFVGMKFDKTPEIFRETMEDAGILFYAQMDDILQNKELLKELGASSASNVKNKRALNKATVLELPKFIDATVITLEMMTNAKAVKEAVNVHNLIIEDKKGKIASSIGYYGDIDGMVILVFPQGIAKKACELLIGENTDDMELILDTLAELVNIVGGKIKTLLADELINVNITLPRTYQDVDSLLEVVENRKGVQVDLSFNDDKFLFFLTR